MNIENRSCEENGLNAYRFRIIYSDYEVSDFLGVGEFL
jgi:hypothetical protein